MRRFLVAALLLWTQVFAVLAPGTLITCSHDDGTAAVEIVGSPCCREACEDDERLARSSEESAGARLRPPSDRCRDASLTVDQTLVGRARTRSVASQSEQLAPTPIAAWRADPRLVAARWAAAPFRAAPPSAVPRRMRPSILRC